MSVFGLDRARELARESHAAARAALAEADGRHRPARPDRRLHPHAHHMTKLLDQIDGPADLKGLDDDQLAAGRAGGPRADHRHDRRDRRPLRREPRRLRDRRGDPLAARLPARQGALGRGPPGLPAQGPHRPPRRASTRSASTAASRPFCSIAGVGARHHGRRPRLDLRVLRGRHQGGDAPRRGAQTARSWP